jgi:hypothetical protein
LKAKFANTVEPGIIGLRVLNLSLKKMGKIGTASRLKMSGKYSFLVRSQEKVSV